MQFDQVPSGSGHVFRVERKAGPAWYAKYRLPDGHQHKKKIGPAWTGRGRPAEGFHNERTANDWLDDVLERAREQVARGVASSDDVLFEAAAHEWLRYCEEDRSCKPSTMRDYRCSVEARLIPAFGGRRLDDITAQHIERWRATLKVSPRTKNKLLTQLYGIFKRAMKIFGLRVNVAAAVEPLRVPKSCAIEVFNPEEIMALCRAAANEQDAAIYLVAAFTGMRRGELIALCWREVDFINNVIRVRASFSAKALTTPKSGKARPVPMAPQVAGVLALLGQRDKFTGEDDLVFPGEDGLHLDGSALRRRYQQALQRAGLRKLRFHDLRHTFATRLVAKADIVRVQEWMGHADIQTTRKYLHFMPRPDDALLVAAAFETPTPPVLASVVSPANVEVAAAV
jgi:integrase